MAMLFHRQAQAPLVQKMRDDTVSSTYVSLKECPVPKEMQDTAILLYRRKLKTLPPIVYPFNYCCDYTSAANTPNENPLRQYDNPNLPSQFEAAASGGNKCGDSCCWTNGEVETIMRWELARHYKQCNFPMFVNEYPFHFPGKISETEFKEVLDSLNQTNWEIRQIQADRIFDLATLQIGRSREFWSNCCDYCGCCSFCQAFTFMKKRLEQEASRASELQSLVNKRSQQVHELAEPFLHRGIQIRLVSEPLQLEFFRQEGWTSGQIQSFASTPVHGVQPPANETQTYGHPGQGHGGFCGLCGTVRAYNGHAGFCVKCGNQF